MQAKINWILEGDIADIIGFADEDAAGAAEEEVDDDDDDEEDDDDDDDDDEDSVSPVRGDQGKNYTP